MSIREPLPPDIIELLKAGGISEDQVEIAIPSDIDEKGQFGQEWLVVAGGHVWVFSRNGHGAVPVRSVPLHQIEGTDTHALVSNVALEVNVGGRPVPLLRYSNSVAGRFARAAKAIEQLSQGHALYGADADDDYDTRHCRSCGRVLLDGSTICPRCLKKGHILRRLLAMARPYWGKMGLITVLLIAGVAVDLFPPYLTKTLIDQVLRSGAHPEWLAYLVGGLLGLQVVRIVITIATARSTTAVSTRFTFDLRETMFARLQQLSLRFHDRNSVGRLMTRVSQDTEELSGFLGQMSHFALNIMLIIGIGAVLFAMNPRLGLFILVPGPLVMLATYRFWRFIRPKFNRYWYARWRINSTLNASLSGIRVVKAFAQEEREARRFGERNRQLLRVRLDVDNSWATFHPLVSFVFGLGGLLVWYVGGKDVLAGEITLGTLIAFINYLGMFYGPLSSLTQISQALNRFLTAAQRILEILDQEPEIVEAEKPAPLPRLKGDIRFEHVSFGYDRYNLVLRDVSFHIRPGELIGIVGQSGAGKTTIVNLLCRFYDVVDGAIYLDGIDIRQIRQADLRSQIGLVLQEPFLFRGSLADNIAYAKPHATRDEIIRAAKAANAHDFIVRRPEGYDSLVGEHGSGLSGGEKQRISIARAILHDPRILILDEATSSVDTETERLIQEALNTLVKGRTTIAIAHRLSTLANAD
ncbi:MAG: ABC transporter ATP-binding protein/permease, partial [Anaerolineae bacterium]|nr:ABC transporter ATP-binding protein/permease [Anaerolineae bacterium]